MAWNGNQPGFASWNAVTSGTNPLQLSTNTGLFDYTTATSNTLQTEINALVVGGTTSLWANYPAIHDVDMSGYSLKNAKYLSTLDLQVSSINGADISIFNSTVTVAGVTINNGTVNTTNITNNPAKGGGGGGGNNPTTGGSGNSTWSMINSAVGATMDTVSKTQQAISGVLNNTGAVLFQTYYAVETAGAIIDLANGAVQLATNAQAMYETREQNLIAGPGGPPGQTSYVFETINGTTQLQFSTLGAPVYSVFRTTDQVNPNQTLGREIFTSTIIPAGSKVVRSVSDPYQFPLMSTIAISTTNYMQSFGQWHAILEPDYNIYASSIKSDSISTLNLSTGSAYINNGVFGGISSLSLSTAQITTSSLIVKGGLTFSTLSGYDITRTLTSSATLYDSVSSVTQNILNYQMNLTSSPESFDMGSYFAITAGNEAFWSHKQLDFSQTLAGIGLLDITFGSYTNGDYFDVKNVGSVNLLIYYSIESNTLLFTLTPGAFYRFTYSSSTNNWTYASNPTQTVQTTNNTFQITQGWNTTTLSTNNLLVMKASEIIIPGALTVQSGFINNITGQNAYLSSIFGNNATFSTLTVSTSYTQNIIDTTVSTSTGVFDMINVSSFYNRFASISSANISSLTTNGITFTSPPNDSYNLTNTFASTTTQTYNAISSLTQNILNYNLSATAATAGIINFGLSFVCNSANVADWEQQVLTTSYVGNAQIALFNLNRTAYFDVYRSVGYPILIYDWTTGSQRLLFSIGTSDTTTYRVTGTVAGAVTTWSYTTSPGTGTTTTINNLTVSQDLQNVYVSTLNRLQVNAGDIYLNGPAIMQTGFANKLYADAAYVSSISTGSLFAGNLSLLNATVQSLTVTSNVSSYNQVAIIQTDGNAQQVDPLEIYTNYTTVGEPSYGYYSPFRTYNNLSTINMLTSQMKYNVYDGYVNVGLGSVSNITFDSNYDLYINNVYLGRPGNKASLGFTSIPYNGSFGSFSGAMIRVMNTLPNPPGTALNAFSVTLSNRAGGSDYVHLYGAGWNSGQVNTDIYMPTYSTGNPAIMYNQAGSNTISILASSPGTPFPNTTQTTVPNDTVSITHVPGGSLSSIIQIASPILNLNSQMYWGSNTKRIEMFSMRMVAFLVSKTAPGGAAYGFADVGGFVTDVNGNFFKTSEYTINCTFGQVNAESQRTLALNSCSLTTEDNGGYWFVHCYATTATIPSIATGGNDVVWAVNVIAMPTELASFQNFQPSQNVGDVIPSSIGAFELQAQLIAPNSHLSSITASTLTFQASENTSLLAGGFTVPTYFSTGSVTVAGTNQVSVLGNIVAIGGQTDVDIQANTNNVNIVANSTITLQGTRFDNVQGAIITSTPTYYVSNSNITATSLVFLTPASPIDKPYWVTYDPGTDFCINVSSLATPTVMNYWVASYSGYGQQLSVSVVATGGTITTISGRRFHTFTTNGSFVLSSTPGATIEIMIIGGGGGGGGWNAGGGGAGNLIVFQYVLTVGSYAVTLGAGGLGGIQSLSIGSQGSSTTFDVLATALGGGGGGTVFIGGGGNGGCGGGGSEVSPYNVPGSGITGTASGTVVQNLATSGGAGTNAGSQGGGGGGGCTVAGSTNSGGSGGAGGDGYTYYGSVYGGGGGGGAGAVGGSGGASGSGGGGAGSGVGISPGIDGTANTGGGGGGVNFGTGGAGGSGICIVSYTYP